MLCTLLSPCLYISLFSSFLRSSSCPLSHCVKPVGRLFPLERGLGSAYPITEYDHFFSHPYSPLPLYAIPPSKPPDLLKFLWSHSYSLGFLIYLLCQYVVMGKRPCRIRATWRLRMHVRLYVGRLFSAGNTSECCLGSGYPAIIHFYYHPARRNRRHIPLFTNRGFLTTLGPYKPENKRGNQVAGVLGPKAVGRYERQSWGVYPFRGNSPSKSKYPTQKKGKGSYV